MKENNAMTSQYPQNGRSMIEMLGVLAIIGVLSVGGIMGYSKAMFRYKINKTIEQITYIAGNIRTTYANQGNYQGLNDNSIWKKAHIFPDDMWTDINLGSQIVQGISSVWESDVHISNKTKNAADTNNNKAFYIQYRNIPEEACIELITQDWNNAQVRLIEVMHGKNYPTTPYYVIPPAKLDDAVAICSIGNDPNIYAIYFFFDVDTSDSMWKDQIDATTATLAGS